MPWQVYSGDRYWTPPLARERRRALYPDRNPRLYGQEPGLFVAEARNLGWTDATVGSIAVWFDPARCESEEQGATAAFGMFEVANEPDMAEALFDAAEMWLSEHVPGLAAIEGPLSLEPLQPAGLLVDGFNIRHGAFLPYNPPYYVEMVEAAGYEPARTLHAYTLALDNPASVPAGIHLLRGAGLELAAALADLYRASELSGADTVPGLADLIAGVGRVRPGLEGRLAQRWLRDYVTIATVEAEGQIVSAAVALPDAGPGLRMGQGRLLPFGWLPYRLALGNAHTLRVFPAVASPNWQGEGTEAALYAGLVAEAGQQGHRRAVFGPVPASDEAAHAALTALGARVTATYQIYRKTY